MKTLVREYAKILIGAMLLGAYWGAAEASFVVSRGGFGIDRFPRLYYSGIIIYAILALCAALPVCILWTLQKAVHARVPRCSRLWLFVLFSIPLCALLLPVANKIILWYLVAHSFILRTQLNSLLVFYGILVLSCGTLLSIILGFLEGLSFWRRMGFLRKYFVIAAVAIPVFLFFSGIYHSRPKSAPPQSPRSQLHPMPGDKKEGMVPRKSMTSIVHNLRTSICSLFRARDAYKNIIFITADALRADHLNCYGYSSRITSPHIDALAAEGVLFENCFAADGWTKPCIASLFTSLFPEQHGCRKYHESLPEEAITLPKIMAAHGYKCFCIIAIDNAYDKNFGMERIPIAKHNASVRKELGLRGIQIRHFLFTKYNYDEVLKDDFGLVFPFHDASSDIHPADQVTAAFKAALEGGMPEPFFMHIHYFEPHQPYLKHPYRHVQLNTWAAWNLRNIVSAYDSQILFLDEAVAGLRKELASRGLAGRTIFALSSDHGEEFLEHGGWSHSRTLYNEILHVPLIMAAPGLLPSGVRVPYYVRGIDIAPTFLDLLHIQRPASFSGHSLLPLIRGDERADRPIIAEMFSPVDDWMAMIDGKWKLLQYGSGWGSRTHRKVHREEIYDLRNDFYEQRDLIHSRPDIAAALREKLKKEREKYSSYNLKPAEQVLTEDTKRQLRALGYLQ